MPPIDSILIPKSSLSDQADFFNILVRLNNDLIHSLKHSSNNNKSSSTSDVGANSTIQKPKLVVKNGEFYLKLPGHNIIRSNKFNETSHIDIYRNINHKTCLNVGRVDMRLNMLYKDKDSNNSISNNKMRLKKIQAIERPKTELNGNGSKKLSQPTRTSSLPNSPRLSPALSSSEDEMSPEDQELLNSSKLVHLLAMGPISLKEIQKIIDVDESTVSTYGEASGSSVSGNKKYNLKLEYFKNLSLSYYTEEERLKLLPILNSRLGELGYDEDNSTRLSINHDFKHILHKLSKLKDEKEIRLKLKEEEEKKREQEEKKKEEELEAEKKRLKAEEEKQQEELKKKITKKVESKRSTSASPQPNLATPTATTSTTLSTSVPDSTSNISKISTNNKEKKRKRTISDSSNSSVNSMRLGDEQESPATSPEEIDEDMLLSEYKRFKTSSVSQPQPKKLSSQQMETFQKFSKRYNLYSALYHNLSVSKVKSRNEFKKLVNLEAEVKSLKKQLWKLEAQSK